LSNHVASSQHTKTWAQRLSQLNAVAAMITARMFSLADALLQGADCGMNKIGRTIAIYG
jgi:hypothetical protein